jgi:hypothetical protein
MTNPILIKRSAVAAKAPATTDLSLGELAINTVDGKLYLKKNVTGTETIVEVGYAVSTAQAAADTVIGSSAASDATAKVLVETNARIAADTAAIATAATAADAKVLVETNARVANDATTLASAKTYADGLITTITGGAGAAFDTLVEIQNAMATDTELSSAIAAITNVPSATKLATARTIQGVAFDGTAAITVATAGTGITVTGTTIATTITQYTDVLATTAAKAAITATGPVVATAGVISMPAATTSVAGHLTAADWNTFNGKQAALGFTPYNATNPSGYVTAAVTLTTAAQTAITSVGTLTSLAVTNAIAAGTVSAATVTATRYLVTGVDVALTATGTTKATALLLSKEINVVSTVAAGSGIVFPVPVAGTRIVVINTSTTALNAYPSFGSINELAVDAAFAVPAGGKLEFVAVSSTKWYTLNATFA